MIDTHDYIRIFPWVMESTDDSEGAPAGEIRSEYIVAVLEEHLPTVPLGELFPRIPRGTPLTRISTGVRMRNVLSREGIDTFGGVVTLSVNDIRPLRAVGVGSLRDFLTGLIAYEIECEAAEGADDDPKRVDVTAEPSAWSGDAIADIETLARWHRLLGAEDAPVLQPPTDIAEPEHVVAARNRLAGLSAASILPALDGVGAAAAAIERALEGLSPQQLDVLRARVFDDHPEALQPIGDRYGVTRERIRQIEERAKSVLKDRIATGELHVLAGVLRDAIGGLVRLRTLVQRYPTVAEIVPSLGQPVWRVLDRLDGAYEITNGWCVAGTIGGAIARTKDLLAASADGKAFVELGTIEGDEAQLSDDWIEFCGITTLGGCAFIGRPSIQDRAEVVLFLAQEPMTSDAILADLGVDRSLSSLKNQLSADERFTRVDRDSWALAAWGMSGYLGIRAMIGRALDEGGGHVSLDALVADLTSRYAVSPNSVVTYASAFPYVLDRGAVRRRVRRDMRRIGRKKLHRTKALYRYGDGVKLRFTVNTEHLRGSGSPLPNAIGEEIDLSVNEARQLPLASADGAILVSWRGQQITLGSVRSELERIGLTAGDTAFFVFHGDGSFEVEATSTDGTPAAALSGGPLAEGEDLLEELAERIDAPEATRDALISLLAARGDSVVAEALAADDSADAEPV